MKAKKPKRTIYRVMWSDELWWYIKVTPPDANQRLLDWAEWWPKVDVIECALNLARADQPSQVLIYSRSRKTGKFRITREFSYGCNSKRRKG